jgi:ATP-dependent exoDNAse (exonuclease V) alpha subunit
MCSNSSYTLPKTEISALFPPNIFLNEKRLTPPSSRLILKIGAKVVLLTNLSLKSGLVNGSQGEVVGFTDSKAWQEADLTEDEKGHLEQFKGLNHTLRPVVKFTNGRTQTIRPKTQGCQKGTSKDPYFVSRTQIPLTLAWALSIHKSQGMTLDYVEVCSDRTFEAGQLYVGLSRATRLEGLTITGVSREQITMPPEVVQFYESENWERLGPSSSSASSTPAQMEAVAEEPLQQSPPKENGSENCNASASHATN